MSQHENYKHAPVVVRLYEKEVQEADLLKALRTDRHRIEKELRDQPGNYAWWGSLCAEVSAKVESLEIDLDQLYAKLYVQYTSKSKEDRLRVTEVKHLIELNSGYQHLRKKLWRWRKSERFLKVAVRAFDQRLYALQSSAADQRREKGQA